MPTRKPAPLPEPLRYLQPFANALAKLRPEDLNEDVDASRLVAALRKRLRGMNEAAADAELAKDRALLERWLADTPDHPAQWIRGFLHSPDLATNLTRPAEPAPPGPEISFEAPVGWTVKKLPFCLNLKSGKVVGSITAIDEFDFENFQTQQERTSKLILPGASFTWTVHDVSAGESHGRKFLLVATAPIRWKKVDYVLRVRGGFVSIMLGTLTGADFDESPLEAKLDTLRLSGSGPAGQ